MSADRSSDPALSEEALRRPRFVDVLARRVLDVFYRRVEVQGLEHVPEDGGVVFVGNHINGLLDPAIFLAYLPRASRFLGKSTLWRIAPLRPFLRLAAAIPVYRRQDGVDASKNAETFAACRGVLAAGGTVALFPEGRSHNEPGLVELKTGVARIVLETLERHPEAVVRIVPVGLTFDEKTRFQSRLLVKIGEPLEPEAPEARLPGSADDSSEDQGDQQEREEASRRAVRRLTDEVRRALEEVTLSYGSWEEARLIERAAAIYSRPLLDTPAEQPMGETFAAHRLLLDGYRRLLEVCPDSVHRVAEEVRDYDRRLESLRLRDEQVASAYPPGAVWRFTLKSLGLIFVRLPFGLLGTIWNAPAYQATAAVARRLTDSPDVASTYKVFPALVLYPAVWLLWALAAARAAAVAGWAWPAVFVAVLAAGPITGYFALRFHQRADLFLDQARAFLLLRAGRRAADLRRRRRRLVERVEELAAAYRQSIGEPSIREPSIREPSAGDRLP